MAVLIDRQEVLTDININLEELISVPASLLPAVAAAEAIDDPCFRIIFKKKFGKKYDDAVRILIALGILEVGRSD